MKRHNVGNNQTKMNFSTPFSPENKSSTVILKWSYCLLKLKKKSFLWNLLFHALVNYLGMHHFEYKWNTPLLSCSHFKFQFSLFNTILLNTLTMCTSLFIDMSSPRNENLNLLVLIKFLDLLYISGLSIFFKSTSNSLFTGSFIQYTVLFEIRRYQRPF